MPLRHRSAEGRFLPSASVRAHGPIFRGRLVSHGNASTVCRNGCHGDLSHTDQLMCRITFKPCGVSGVREPRHVHTAAVLAERLRFSRCVPQPNLSPHRAPRPSTAGPPSTLRRRHVVGTGPLSVRQPPLDPDRLSARRRAVIRAATPRPPAAPRRSPAHQDVRTKSATFARVLPRPAVRMGSRRLRRIRDSRTHGRHVAGSHRSSNRHRRASGSDRARRTRAGHARVAGAEPGTTIPQGSPAMPRARPARYGRTGTTGSRPYNSRKARPTRLCPPAPRSSGPARPPDRPQECCRRSRLPRLTGPTRARPPRYPRPCRPSRASPRCCRKAGRRTTGESPRRRPAGPPLDIRDRRR